MENLKSQEEKAIEALRMRMKDSLPSPLYEDNLLFYRFLKARNFDVNNAETMLKKHIIWRKAYKVDTILEEYKPPVGFMEHIQGTYLGEDKEGCGIRYVNVGDIVMRDVNACFKINDYFRCLIWILESDFKRLKEANEKTGKSATKMLMITNLENLTFSNATNPSSAALYIRLGHTMQDNYPERLKFYFTINAPTYTMVIFSILKAVLQSEIINKIRVYGKSGWQQELLKIVDADILPAFLGGTRTDPDGNPMCKTFIMHNSKLPHKYCLTDEDRTFKCKSLVKQVRINPRTKCDICVEVDECGSLIQWEYEVHKKNIGFGLYFKESEHKLEEIVPVYLFETADGIETGSHKCEWIGTYVFVFDNTHSMLSTKEISYCIAVLKPDK